MKAAFIYMASGFGSRFGGNKLLEELEGKPLYRHGLDTLRKAADLIRREKGWQIRLIVVSQYREILEEAAREGLQAVYNPESARGITASIAYGTRAAGRDGYFPIFCGGPAQAPAGDDGRVFESLRGQRQNHGMPGLERQEGKSGGLSVLLEAGAFKLTGR